jgi:hypothetical protein
MANERDTTVRNDSVSPTRDAVASVSWGHHDIDSRAALGPVKARRFAPPALSAADGLDGALDAATDGLIRDGRQRWTNAALGKRRRTERRQRRATQIDYELEHD